MLALQIINVMCVFVITVSVIVFLIDMQRFLVIKINETVEDIDTIRITFVTEAGHISRSVDELLHIVNSMGGHLLSRMDNLTDSSKSIADDLDQLVNITTALSACVQQTCNN